MTASQGYRFYNVRDLTRSELREHTVHLTFRVEILESEVKRLQEVVSSLLEYLDVETARTIPIEEKLYLKKKDVSEDNSGSPK